MYFFSPIFIFLYLPLIFIITLYLKKKNPSLSLFFLFLFSIFLLSTFNIIYALIFIISVITNYIIIKIYYIKKKKLYLYYGVIINLIYLFYLKYKNFFFENISNLFGINLTYSEIILPVGISFYTFQQIAFLIDTSRNQNKEISFIHYLTFVTFFPQLIAGPIVFFKEVNRSIDFFLKKKIFLL